MVGDLALDMRFGSQLSCSMSVCLGWEFLYLLEMSCGCQRLTRGSECALPHAWQVLFVVLRLHGRLHDSAGLAQGIDLGSPS